MNDYESHLSDIVAYPPKPQIPIFEMFFEDPKELIRVLSLRQVFLDTSEKKHVIWFPFPQQAGVIIYRTFPYIDATVIDEFMRVARETGSVDVVNAYYE